MRRLIAYCNSAYKELFGAERKVTWPTWQELQSSAVVVLVAAAILGLVLWAMDFSSSRIMQIYYDAV
jgi:preprotein translocase subunit SecE